VMTRRRREIDISGGGWRRRASVFDSGNGRRWALAFDGDHGRQLWQRWTIETTFNGGSDGGVQWRQQRLTVFDGVGDGLRREDERAAQGQATQQPAST
jgi:outer membrane protein assembly factor BamB